MVVEILNQTGKKSKLTAPEKRVEEIIQESLEHTAELGLPAELGAKINLAKTEEEILAAMRIRYDVYDAQGYLDEFPAEIEGIEFDEYDRRSAHILYKGTDGEIEGTIRLIHDPSYSQDLPTMSKIDERSRRGLEFGDMKYGEISRLAVNPEYRGLDAPYQLFAGVYAVSQKSGTDRYLMSMMSKHASWYRRLGGTRDIESRENFGEIEGDISCMTWNPNPVFITPHAKRRVLSRLRPELSDAIIGPEEISERIAA